MSHFNLLIKSYFTDFRAYPFSNWTFISAISLVEGGSSPLRLGEDSLLSNAIANTRSGHIFYDK